MLQFVLLCFTVTSFVSTSVQYKRKQLKIGIEIIDVDLGQARSDVLERIKEDVYLHRLVLIRNQSHLTMDNFTAIFSVFGEPFKWKPFTMDNGTGLSGEEQIIQRISNDDKEGYTGLGRSGWHIDGAYTQTPFSFVIFHSKNASLNGDTKFVGHREVLASMRQETIQKLSRLSAVFSRKVLDKSMYEIHPIIYDHPIVNESVMCIHMGYMNGLIRDYGTPQQRVMNRMELMQVKEEITREIEKDDQRLVYSHEWTAGDLIIVDNLQIAHMASPGSQLPREKCSEGEEMDEMGINMKEMEEVLEADARNLPGGGRPQVVAAHTLRQTSTQIFFPRGIQQFMHDFTS